MHSQELYNLDTTEWDARFVFSHLRDLEQHYTLISLLLIKKDRNSGWGKRGHVDVVVHYPVTRTQLRGKNF